jgi:hypothetical protein
MPALYSVTLDGAGNPASAATPLPVRNAAASLTDSITVTPIVANATAVVVAAANANRKTLVLMNDTNDAWYGYSSSVNAATGMPLQAGSGFAWGLGEADPRAVYVFSTNGTTIRAKEGV